MKTKRKKNKKPDPLSYRERSYRQSVDAAGLTPSRVTVCETDLFILADCEVRDLATRLVLHYRSQLEGYIARNPAFLHTLSPLPIDPTACPLVKAMMKAAHDAGVGPMAAVAGAIAEFVGRDILQSGCSKEIIIENGGDIFLSRTRTSSVAIYAGSSPLSNRVGIKISPAMMPLGICTSSGTIGHSLSLGQADSVTVLAPSTPLADAAATRLGNEMKGKNAVHHAIEAAKTLPGLTGVVIVQDDHLGVWGEIELIPLGA
ncbi:MAG: hypothetical protein BM485_08400 [Desulfobulbaceae bacterium DB1]|nr:MAG: hypothetical protein BM485_08400 [Desulfobulbaceae bacterium DB1]